jgi:hypothetical protein
MALAKGAVKGNVRSLVLRVWSEQLLFGSTLPVLASENLESTSDPLTLKRLIPQPFSPDRILTSM